MEWGVAAPSLGMALLSLSLLPEKADIGLPMAGLFALIAVAFGALGWRSWVDVRLEDDQLQLTQGGAARTMPASSVRAVRVVRATRPLLPTTVQLLVAGERPIPFARYSLFGRQVLLQAQQLGERLQVPVADPVGDQLTASRFAPLRWRGAGDDWAYVLMLTVPALLLLAIGVAVQLS